MNEEYKLLRQSLIDFFGMIGVQFRAALSTRLSEDDYLRKENGPIDPEFEGWVNNDPMVIGNPASRYGDDAPGYLTGNGLGSLEIGAADD